MQVGHTYGMDWYRIGAEAAQPLSDPPLTADHRAVICAAVLGWRHT